MIGRKIYTGRTSVYAQIMLDYNTIHNNVQVNQEEYQLLSPVNES